MQVPVDDVTTYGSIMPIYCELASYIIASIVYSAVLCMLEAGETHVTIKAEKETSGELPG